MTKVSVYMINRKATFRPDGPPAAVVAVPGDCMVDPAKDRAYVGPIGSPTDTYRPGGLLIAARSGMFGLRVVVNVEMSDNPPAPPRPRRK
jgi:hypothetical protein